MSGSSSEGMKPRRAQNAAASASTALTISARPPIRLAAVTQRCNACLSRPVPIPMLVPILISRKLSQQQAGDRVGRLTGPDGPRQV
jgi:hypothetical protein